MTHRNAVLLCLSMLLCSSRAAYAQNSLSPEQKHKQWEEKELARWKAMLDEYRQGKRDDNDGAAIFFNVMHYYNVLRSSTTTEAIQAKKEWQALLVKHPDFRLNPPLHIHEEIEARKAEQELVRTLDAKAESFTPKDSRVFNVLGYEGHMVLVYQYHIDFFHLPSSMKLERSGDRYTLFHLNDGGRIMDRFKISDDIVNRGLKPFKTMSFRHHAVSSYEVSGAKDFRNFIWICDEIPSYYAGSDNEEGVILRRKHATGEMSWLNEAGEYGEFCGAVSLEGKVIYQLPIKQHLPDAIITLGHTNSDGSSIDMQVGELVTANIVDSGHLVDAAPGQSVQHPGNYRQHLIYTYPDRLETYDEKDQQGIAKALKDHGF